MGDKGGKKDKEKNKQQQVRKQKEEEQKQQDKSPAQDAVGQRARRAKPAENECYSAGCDARYSASHCWLTPPRLWSRSDHTLDTAMITATPVSTPARTSMGVSWPHPKRACSAVR